MTTVHQPYIQFFAGMGFRPAIQVMHRDQYGDKPIWIVGDDAAYLAKWEAPADTLGHGFGFVLYPDTPAPAQLTAAELAGTIPGPFTAGPLIPGPWHPPVDYPCNCVTHPPSNPPLPEPAPVPLPASAGLLLVAVAALALWGRK